MVAETDSNDSHMNGGGSFRWRLAFRTVHLGKFIIPVLLFGAFALFLAHDESRREVSSAQLRGTGGSGKPYLSFQQLPSWKGGASLEEMQRLDGHSPSRKVMAGALIAEGLAGPGARPSSGANGTGGGFDALGSAQLGGVQGTAGAAHLDSAGRMAAVKEAMQHSWRGYADYAWGSDELLPLSKKGTDSFCRTGATILDALDTLWVMGLAEEFARARDWVGNDLYFNNTNCATSLFELVIRDVGGLLAAYDLSGDRIFVTRAQEFADRMLSAFDTDTGIPLGVINLALNTTEASQWTGGTSSVLSELGSNQVEFIRLSQLTGDPKYGAAAERVIQYLHDHFQEGLLPTYIDNRAGTGMGSELTMGAMADSYYEYLLKVWILTGHTKDMYREMWVAAMDDMDRRLVRTSGDGYQYVGSLKGTFFEAQMEHLTCFVAGNLALGVFSGAVTGENATRYLDLAKNLTTTCYQMYRHMPTGLSPESVSFYHGVMVKQVPYNILRPEVVESLFYLWRITGDPTYQEWGWSIFSAFNNYSRVDSGGFSGIADVGQIPPAQDDKMQTFWLAETLKYLYLLFSPNTTLPLDQWVFNTECHPLRVERPAAQALATLG